MSTEKDGQASIVLPVSVRLPGRFAVPVQVRSGDGVLVDTLTADGRYHPVPADDLTFLATLPDGRIFQASTRLTAGMSVRITLQGDLRSPEPPAVAHHELVDAHRTAIRFYRQRSVSSYRRELAPKALPVGGQISDTAQFRVGASDQLVHFVQLLRPRALPVNIAGVAGELITLSATENRLSADLRARDERVDLAYRYLRAGRAEIATHVLALQGLHACDPSLTGVLDRIICLQIALAQGDPCVETMALRLAEMYPAIADFLIVAAQVVMSDGRYEEAADLLFRLHSVGLPLLYRSYAQALTLLKVLDRTMEKKSEVWDDLCARLRDLAPHVDPASSILVVRGRHPAAPSSELTISQRIYTVVSRAIARHEFKIAPQGKAAVMTTSTDTGTDTTTTPAEPAKKIPQTHVALVLAAFALFLWGAFTVFMTSKSGASDVEWTRLAWLFSSVEAVAFAAAGLIFGSTVNRQRAERAETQAKENQKDAESGRALSAAIKADEPPVAVDGTDGKPRALGANDGRAVNEVAARHARLARELFP